MSRALGFQINEAQGLNISAYALLNLGNYPASLQRFLSGIEMIDNIECESVVMPENYRRSIGILSEELSPRTYRLQVLAYLHLNLGILYENTSNKEKGLSNYFRSLELGIRTGNRQIIGGSSMNIGRIYQSQNLLDSALLYLNNAYDAYEKIGLYDYMGSVMLNLGRIYLAKGDEQIAVDYFHNAINTSNKFNYKRGAVAANLILADINLNKKNMDSAFLFTQNALLIAQELNAPDLLLRIYNSLSKYYQLTHNNDSAVKYLNYVITYKDDLFNTRLLRQFQNIEFDAQLRKKEIESAQKKYRDLIQKYLLGAGLAILMFTASILWRNYRKRIHAYQLLERQKQETELQKTKLEQSFRELRGTQAQLIQKEKMASLGELTAGIAHEIQNPLNFVNNFSDINKELFDELEVEIEKGDKKEIAALIRDLRENETKIMLHGKRADGIVKSMLQHSRTTSAVKELTDINALCDEYLRLAYHGMRAKDKSFTVDYKTELDPHLPKINVMAQDIGRVLLNLINNAFQAVDERAKKEVANFQPQVTVRTHKLPDAVKIVVEDNGTGIPEHVKGKIFQPFFTTKPTGQGAGLGLSLSYDIISKGHGGELTLETVEGQGTTFIVRLPLN